MDQIEVLMDQAWPAAERHDTGSWVLRATGGVTQRANSIWPRTPSANIDLAVAQAQAWYRLRRLPVIFQISDGADQRELHDALDNRGFTRQSRTLIMEKLLDSTASEKDAARTNIQVPGINEAAMNHSILTGRPSRVEFDTTASAEWLDLWWRVDGRGGAEALPVAAGILAGCESLYALVRDAAGGVAAVGRLALTGGTPGIYAVATHPGHRRQGYGLAVTEALVAAAQQRGCPSVWLLVTAANHGAQDLYRGLGFVENGGYVYRQERPRRHLTGC